MTDHSTERTTGGLVGKLTGKVKAAVGAVVGDDELAREGRLQDAQSDAELEARRAAGEARQRQAEVEVDAAITANELEREKLGAELAGDDAQARIERDRDRAEQLVEAQSRRDALAAEADRHVETTAATAAERQAMARKLADDEVAARLEREAREAERKADAIDPKEQ